MVYLDLNTSFLFGEPIGMLSGKAPPHASGFLDAFQTGFNGCGMRIALGPLKVLLPKGNWLKACKKVHDFADIYVERALQYRKEHQATSNASDEKAPPKQRTLLYNMALQTDNKTHLRDLIIQAMMAATETTASLISSTIFMLAIHPAVFATLRTEVEALGTRPLTFDTLPRIRYLQNILKEVLRLHPVFPQNNRVALRDTILPTGGGPDGTSRVFAPPGTLFDTCFATLHRDKKIWGPDADDFRPERWDADAAFSPSPFEYMPFGAGQRQCLAQQKATMEAAYVVARMGQMFGRIGRGYGRGYRAQVALTAKNANGCFVGVGG